MLYRAMRISFEEQLLFPAEKRINFEKKTAYFYQYFLLLSFDVLIQNLYRIQRILSMYYNIKIFLFLVTKKLITICN